MGGSSVRILIIVGTQGRGTNMQTIIDGCVSGYINGSVVGVIGTGAGSPALERAAAAGIPTVVVPYLKEAPDEFDARMDAAISEISPDLIVLGGFLRKLSREVVHAYSGRIINTHPALIPSFCGSGMYGHHVHEAVLACGVKVSGCTVHFVDEEYDAGPVIMQSAVPVEDDDTVDTLSARVLKEEHLILRESVRLFAEGRLRIDGRKVFIEGPDGRGALTAEEHSAIV